MGSMIEAVEPRMLLAAQPPALSELIQAGAATRTVVTKDKASLAQSASLILADLKRLHITSAQSAAVTKLGKTLFASNKSLSTKVTSTSTKLVGQYRKLLVDIAAVQKHSTTANQKKLQKDFTLIEGTANKALPALLSGFNTLTQVADKGLLSIAALKSDDAQLQQHVQSAIAEQNQASLDFTDAAQNWLSTTSV